MVGGRLFEQVGSKVRRLKCNISVSLIVMKFTGFLAGSGINPGSGEWGSRWPEL